MAMDCSLPGCPDASLHYRASPCPPCLSTALSTYKPLTAETVHHFSSSPGRSHELPLPSPTHGQSYRYAAFCGVHPSLGLGTRRLVDRDSALETSRDFWANHILTEIIYEGCHTVLTAIALPQRLSRCLNTVSKKKKKHCLTQISARHNQ